MSCLPAIQSITAAGGWVIRMGDETMTRLPKMERVIDYPFTSFKSELMDLYLLKNCRMAVSLGGSLADVSSLLFGTQAVIACATELYYTPRPQKNLLAITKHIYSRKLGRFLSIRELLEEPEPTFWDPESYTLKHNTPEEILDLVREGLSKIQGKTGEPSALQLEFVQARKAMIRRYIVRGLAQNYAIPYLSPSEFDIWQKYRVASKIIGAQGRIGAKYLERNWNQDQVEGSPGLRADRCPTERRD